MSCSAFDIECLRLFSISYLMLFPVLIFLTVFSLYLHLSCALSASLLTGGFSTHRASCECGGVVYKNFWHHDFCYYGFFCLCLYLSILKLEIDYFFFVAFLGSLFFSHSSQQDVFSYYTADKICWSMTERKKKEVGTFCGAWHLPSLLRWVAWGVGVASDLAQTWV